MTETPQTPRPYARDTDTRFTWERTPVFGWAVRARGEHAATFRGNVVRVTKRDGRSKRVLIGVQLERSADGTSALYEAIRGGGR